MFETNIFASVDQLAYGAITGLIFGVILQRSGVARFNTIVNQFLLKDFTVLKVMLTAVLVGGVGIYGMKELSIIEGLHIKDAAIAGVVVGGAIFAIGMAILGYCPGTVVAAAGDGARDAKWGILGMLVGAGTYAELYPLAKEKILPILNLGKQTLPEAFGISHWLIIVALVVIAAVAFGLAEKQETKYANEDDSNQTCRTAS